MSCEKNTHVLMISLASEMFSGKICDTLQRHCEYAGMLGSLHVIVYTGKSDSCKPRKIKNLYLYPTQSKSKFHFGLDALRAGIKIIQRFPVTVISTQDPFVTGFCGLLLKLFFSLPLDIQNHSDFIDNRKWIFENFPRNSVLNIFSKWLISFGDTHRVLNSAEKEKYISYGICPEQIKIITTPVNHEFSYEETERDILRKELLPAGKNHIIFWVGRCVKFKNVPLLLHAFSGLLRKHPDAFLVLAGDGEEKIKWDSLREKLGVRNHSVFLDGIPHTHLGHYYKAADVYVHPSYYEGYGKTMVEAALCGLPVVANDSNGARDCVVPGETGIIVKHNSVKALREALEYILEHRQSAVRMGQNGRERCRKVFDRDMMVSRVCRSFAECGLARGKKI